MSRNINAAWEQDDEEVVDATYDLEDFDEDLDEDEDEDVDLDSDVSDELEEDSSDEYDDSDDFDDEDIEDLGGLVDDDLPDGAFFGVLHELGIDP